MRQVEEVLKRTEGIVACTGVGGSGILTNSFSPEFASFFCKLEPWEERNTPELHVSGIQQTLRRSLAAIPGAVIFPFTPPTIPGFGAAGGFNFLLQDRSGTMSVAELGKQTQVFLDAARQRPEVANLFTSFNPQVPQVQVELDREKARSLGVPINDVFAALSAAMGGAYVNDFNRFGRLYRVYVQAEPAFRQRPEDIGQFYVRSRTTNEMVPLSTLMTVTPASGTEITVRFNLFRSVEITGVPGAGLYVGAGDDGARGNRDPGTASRNGVCLLRLFLPGEAGAARRAHVRPGHRLRVPAPGGAVRELEAALGGAAGNAAGGAGRVPGSVGRRATTTTCSSRSA